MTMPSARFSRSPRRFGLLLLLFAVLATPMALAADADNVIRVGGQVAQASDWTAARLEKELATDMQTVQFTSHGQQHAAKCVSLLDLLKAAGVETDLKMGPKVDPKEKNYALRLMVIVAGRDGYTAAFSLGELLPDVGHEDAWLAVEVDGKALGDADGPARLIVPGDAKPARWVRGVGTISIVDGAKAATTQPG
jgi:DMSO/TMAO reductase YedYZ molybdopterin-dependent catalytic subunit